MRILRYAGIALAVWWIIKDPAAAAALTHKALSLIGQAANSATTFLSAI